MGQNLSQCKSEQHLTWVRTQFWLLAFETLFFFSSVAPASHIWEKKKRAKTIERDRPVFMVRAARIVTKSEEKFDRS